MLSPKPIQRRGWQFDIKNYGDDINLIYVACTRAKKTLSLPKTIKDVLQEFDFIHMCINEFKNAANTLLHSDQSMMVIRKETKMTKGQLWDLYHDLCLPLRNELGVDEDSNIMKSVFDDMDDDDETSSKLEQIRDEHQSQVEC